AARSRVRSARCIDGFDLYLLARRTANDPRGGKMAYGGQRQVREARSRRAAIVALAATLVAGRSGHAVMDATTECLIGFSGVPDADKNGGTSACTGCDPACDDDGAGTGNGSCTVTHQPCANRGAGACRGAALQRVNEAGGAQG